MPTGSLPEEGKKVFEKVFSENKHKGDEYAAKVAWTAVHNAGWKKNDEGQWVKGKSEFAEFSMAIVKASFDKENQVMRWRSVNSDTDPDLYDEAMSTELYEDFVARIENNTPVPSPFDKLVCEDSWCGGMPYLSLAHYKSGKDKMNVAGEPDSVYVDGKMLKSTGILYDNPLGKAVFNALNKDLYTKKSDGSPEVDPDRRVRVSIGFLDLQHKHLLDDGTEKVFTRTDLGQICHLCASGIGRKIYEKGQLVHLALTRVPVNPRTLMEVDKSMDTIVTKKDDARSIVGDLADELEEKSMADGVLVVKSEGMTLDFPEDMADKCYDPNTGMYDQECIDDLMMGHMPPMRNEMMKNRDVKGKAVYDDESLSDRVDSIRQAFAKQFASGLGMPSFNGWVEDVYESYVIVSGDGKKYKVPYTETENGCEFGDISKWRPIKEVYVDEKSDTVSKAVTKGESWGDEPSSSYLVVGDPKHPTTWHLPVKKNGKLDTGLMGAAKAALTSNHRGHSYGGPDKQKALAKLRSLYKSHGMEWGDEKKSITEESTMADVNETTGKKKSVKPEEIDSFEDEERVPSNKEAYGQGKSKAEGKDMESEKEDQAEGGEDKEDAKAKKSLTSKVSSVVDTVMKLRSAGVSDTEAEAALQPLLNELGSEISKALHPSAGDAAVAQALAVVAKAQADTAQALQALSADVAVLKAQKGMKVEEIKSPFIKPRSMSVVKSAHAQETRQLSQIEKIARRSAGLPLE